MKLKIIVLALMLFSAKLFPCSCLSPTPELALKAYPVVFIGKLLSTSVLKDFYPTGRVRDIKYWNFQVVRYIKGIEASNSIVSILSEGFNCDINFSYHPIGTEFIIYADNINEYGFYHLLTTGQCSQTKVTSEITDTFELNIYKDKNIWKYPTPSTLKPGLKKDTDKQPESKSIFDLKNLLISLVLLNLILTIYLVARKK